MSIEVEELYNILSDQSCSGEEQVAAVTTFKAEVKRSFIKIDNVARYFEALTKAVESADYTLHAVAFSCICHLVKRIITQDPHALREPSKTVLPVIINKFGDAKASVRSTARRVFEDYWISCPTETEDVLRDTGLTHENADVRLECLQILIGRVQLQESKFAFRAFTSPVIELLHDSNDQVRQASEELLILFFKSAHTRAKQDLSRELSRHPLVNKSVVSRILKAIGAAALPTSAGSASSTPTSLSKPFTANSQQLHSTTPTMERTQTSKVKNKALSISFIVEDRAYLTDHLSPEHVSSAAELREDVEAMVVSFEGKESEFNWQQREKCITRLRKIISGNAPHDFPEDTAEVLKIIADGICKAVASLRTTLSSHGCYLVREAVVVLGTRFDSTIEPFLSHLVKMSMSTKKITHQAASMTVNAMILNTSYSPRYLLHCQRMLDDKGAFQSKIYAALWIRLIACKHNKHHTSIDSSGGVPVIQSLLIKALGDANPGVREQARLAFWAFYETWPQDARAMLEKFDGPTKKALERSNPNPSTASTAAGGALSAGARAKPGASRPSMKELIAKSKAEKLKEQQRQKAVSAPVHERDRDHGLVNKPGRLGMPQRNRVVSNSGSTSTTSSSTKSLPTRGTVAATSAPVRSTSDSLDVKKTASSAPVKPASFPTVFELLMTDDPSKFDRGLNILSYLLQGIDIPEYFEVYRPASMPRPDIVSRVLKRLFQTDNGDQIKLFVKPEIVEKIPQFVKLGDIVNAVVLYSNDAGSSLRKILKHTLANERFTLLSQQELTPVVIELLESLAADSGLAYSSNILLCTQELQTKNDPRLGPVFFKLAERFPEVESELHVLPPGRNIAAEPASTVESEVEHEKVEINDAELLPPLDEDQPVVEMTEPETEPVVEMAEPEPAVDHPIEKIGNTEESKESEVAHEVADKAEPEEKSFDSESNDSSELILAGSPAKSSAVENTEVEPPQQILEDSSDDEMQDAEHDESVVVVEQPIVDEEKSRAEVVIEETPVELTSVDTQTTQPEQTTNTSPIFSDDDENDKENAAPQMNELATDVEQKLTIEKRDDSGHAAADLATPKKGGITNSPSWYSFESKKQVCLSPLPQREDQASRLFESLIEQLDNKTIDAHGFRKLVTIVKGAKNGEPGVAFSTWIDEQRQDQLQLSLIEYLSDPTGLSEHQLNLGLLQLKQLLSVAEPGSFGGSEVVIFKILLEIAGTSTGKTIVYGALRETQQELISIVERHQVYELFEAVAGCYQSQYNREQKVLIVATLARLVSRLSAGSVAKVIGQMSRIVLSSISDRETYVRKEAYPLLVNLRAMLTEDQFAPISSELSDGQRHLMEYYIQKR